MQECPHPREAQGPCGRLPRPQVPPAGVQPRRASTRECWISVIQALLNDIYALGRWSHTQRVKLRTSPVDVRDTDGKWMLNADI